LFTSVLSTVVFTVVFTVTAVYALLRFARMSSGDGAPGDRLVELFHLLMSVAMVGMAVGWTGGPGTPRGIVQLVVFGAFTLYFVARAVSGTPEHGRVAAAHHVVMSAAMTWMVTAMPQMVGMSMAGGGEHVQHGGADEAAGAGAMEPAAAAPGWVTAVSVVFVALLLIAACWWVARLLRGDDADAVDAADGVGGTATQTSVSVSTLARVDTAVHVLMSIGMAGMLVAML
jgi:hypothetical protein